MIFFKHNSNEYCFVHIPKTAGLSLELSITKTEKTDNTKNIIFKNHIEKFNCKHQHMPFYYINNTSKKIFLNSDIKYLTIIRNPWNRLASLFEQQLLREKVGLKPKLKNKDVRNYNFTNFDSLTEEILKNLNLRNINELKSLFKYWILYLGYNPKILPNLNPNLTLIPQSWWFIDDFENEQIEDIFLFEDLETIEKKFEINLTKENTKKIQNNYSDYYNQETIDYVSKLDKLIIDKYGYSFII